MSHRSKGRLPVSLFTFFFGPQSAIPKKELLRLLDADRF